MHSNFLTFEEITLTTIFIHMVQRSFQEQRIPQYSLCATTTTSNLLDFHNGMLTLFIKG